MPEIPKSAADSEADRQFLSPARPLRSSPYRGYGACIGPSVGCAELAVEFRGKIRAAPAMPVFRVHWGRFWPHSLDFSWFSPDG
jgi:hypothetical protein